MKVIHRLKDFWGSENSLTIFLFFLITVVFIVPIFPSEVDYTDVIVDFLAVSLLIAGIFAFPVSRILTILIVSLIVSTAFFRILSYVQDQDTFFEAMEAFLSMLCLLFFIKVILVQVFKDGDVTTHRVLGAVSVYILIGVVWGHFYELIEILIPASFSSASGQVLNFNQLSYFSFVTLTTVGFGDIVPVSHAARSFAVAEALIGQLFPTILIGRLVSLLVVKKKH